MISVYPERIVAVWTTGTNITVVFLLDYITVGNVGNMPQGGNRFCVCSNVLKNMTFCIFHNIIKQQG